ncbi:Uncharacterized protein SCF082_LOCUS14819 [Durusdinium trenchii]|uniref:Uncharacterized protein n=1 Tax=Durusdinium trenchii TaxID=1381693 RepID=A0ABP0K0B4_9DINO
MADFRNDAGASNSTTNNNSSAQPRLEFHSNIEWAPAYQRNNKANGQKNLRCFPNHCQGLGHQRGFCGHSIVINFFYLPPTVKGKLYSFGHFCIADCELNSPAAAAAKGVSRERFKPGDILPMDQVQPKIRQADEPLLEYIEGLELQDRRLDADGTVRVNFEFNRNLKGWHYGFLGSKLTRNVYHTFRSYVLEHVAATAEEPEHYRVLAAVTSPKWKLFCRRRNRTGVLPPKLDVPAPKGKSQRGRKAASNNSRKMGLDGDHLLDSAGPSDPNAFGIPMSLSVPGMRQAKKRRESSACAEIGCHSSQQHHHGQMHGHFGKSASRRFSNIPGDSGDYFGLGQSHSHLAQHQRQMGADPFAANQYYNSMMFRGDNDHDFGGTGRGQAQHMEDFHPGGYDGNNELKYYVRRLASHERLEATGRSTITRKRTSDSQRDHVLESKSSEDDQHGFALQQQQQQQQQQHEKSRGRHRSSSGGSTTTNNNNNNNTTNAWSTCFGQQDAALGRHHSIPHLVQSNMATSSSSSSVVPPPPPPPPLQAMASTGASSMGSAPPKMSSKKKREAEQQATSAARHKCLLRVLHMVDLDFTKADPHTSLALRDHSQFELFSEFVLELLLVWESTDRRGPVKVNRKTRPTSFSHNEPGLASFLLSKQEFLDRISVFVGSKPVEQRKTDPYGTVSFVFNILKHYLLEFVSVFGPASSGSSSSTIPGIGGSVSVAPPVNTLYPCMSTLSLKGGLESLLQDRGSPTRGGDRENVARSGNAAVSRTASVKLGDMDLERFTQELEPLATSDGMDDLALRATKSWKTMSSAKLQHKLSQNLLAASAKASCSNLLKSQFSEHSIMNASFFNKNPKRGSLFSLSNIPSALHLAGPAASSNAKSSHNATASAISLGIKKPGASGAPAGARGGSNKAGNSMKELDDFLKKECGVQEVEEVEG